MFNHDQGATEQALDVFRPLAVVTVLPGHGPALHGPSGDLVDEAAHRS